jgi:hypothetical protein
MYLYVRSTSQESELSCICMLEVQAKRASGHVFACCTPNIQIHDHPLSWLVLLTYKYMTTHSPGLVQANSVLLTCKYMTTHSPGLYTGECVVMYLHVWSTEFACTKPGE